MKFKFIKQVFGPIHAETRFAPLAKYNKETLNNYIFLIDHPKLYEKYKDQFEIISMDELRKDHLWSNEKEILYQETNIPEYIQNFKKFYTEQHLTPFNLLRFAFKYLAEQEILNVAYIGNNCFMTNKQELINKYFSSIPAGIFHYPHQNCIYNPISILANKLKAQYPNINFPANSKISETYMFGCHFKNKEEMLLFYEMWDFIMREIHFNDNGWFPEQPKWISYESVVDNILGYLVEVFKINFGYQDKEFLEFWDNGSLGWHFTCPHDTLAYGNPLPYKEINSNNNYDIKFIPKPSELDPVFSVSDYIKKYKNELMAYYNGNSTHCNIILNEETHEITILHKNL